MVDVVGNRRDYYREIPECSPSGAPERFYLLRNQGLTPLAIGVAPLRGSHSGGSHRLTTP